MLRGIEKLTPDNHTLYRRVQHLVRLQWHWEAIALEVAVPNVKALCEWVLEYREPRSDKFQNMNYVNTVPVRMTTEPKRMTAQFLAWKKQHDGASERLQSIKAESVDDYAGME